MTAPGLEIIACHRAVHADMMASQGRTLMASADTVFHLDITAVDAPVTHSVTVALPRIHPVSVQRKPAGCHYAQTDIGDQRRVVEHICRDKESVGNGMPGRSESYSI